MMDYQNPSPEQQQVMRNQAFYLLKKYTSVTWLQEAIRLHQALLNQMAVLLNKPEFAKEHNEAMYRRFLNAQIPNEEGLELLKNTPHKSEAYQKIYEGIERPWIWGSREIDSYGTFWLPFMIELGIRGDDRNIQTWVKEFAQWLRGFEKRKLILRTTLKLIKEDYGLPYAGSSETNKAWNWISLFTFNPRNNFLPSLELSPNYPTPLPPCPEFNLEASIKVWSDQEIPVTGIYEPWFINGHRGCPNYYLTGQTALQYPLEESDQLEVARWHLLWEDKRYLDGVIPKEEEAYFKTTVPLHQPSTLAAQPASICSKAGVWTTTALLETRQITLKIGEPFPVVTQDKSGNSVIWYWTSH